MARYGWSPRSWAYAGALLGGAVSVGANTAHSYLPPAGAPAGWKPPTGAVVGAVFWPVALFVAIEILARTAWPGGVRWRVVRLVGLVPVAVVAAAVSYNHLSGLLAHYGEDRLTVLLGPVAVDGLMVMSSAAVLAAPRQSAIPMEHAPGCGPEPAPETAPAAAPVAHAECVREPAPLRRRSARRSAPARRSEEQLLEQARALNQAVLEQTGAPVSKRALMRQLHVGQPTANRIHAALLDGGESDAAVR